MIGPVEENKRAVVPKLCRQELSTVEKRGGGGLYAWKIECAQTHRHINEKKKLCRSSTLAGKREEEHAHAPVENQRSKSDYQVFILYYSCLLYYFARLSYRGSTAVPYAAVLWSNTSISRQHSHPLTDSKSNVTFRNVP